MAKLATPTDLNEMVATGDLTEQERTSLLWAMGMTPDPGGLPALPGTTASTSGARRARRVASPALTGHPLDEV